MPWARWHKILHLSRTKFKACFIVYNFVLLHISVKTFPRDLSLPLRSIRTIFTMTWPSPVHLKRSAGKSTPSPIRWGNPSDENCRLVYPAGYVLFSFHSTWILRCVVCNEEILVLDWLESDDTNNKHIHLLKTCLIETNCPSVMQENDFSILNWKSPPPKKKKKQPITFLVMVLFLKKIKF